MNGEKREGDKMFERELIARLLNLQEIIISVLSQLGRIQSGKSGPAKDHDVR